MKQLVAIILFTFSTIASLAQNFSLKFDSVTKICLQQLPDKYKTKHDTILKQRSLCGIYSRMDTSSYDYLFITERFDYSDSSMEVTEEYYNENKDTLKYVFENGVRVKNGFDDLRFMKKIYSGYKPVQQLPYSKIELREHDRWCQPVRKFKREIKNSLKSTYSIMTMIDKKNKTVKISIWYPVDHPVIFTIYVGGGKC